MLEINGHRARVETAGSGPPVVLVHGLTGSVDETWTEVIRALATDHLVVAYDLRGAGASEVTAGPYSFDLLGADLAALLDALQLTGARLVGHSLGGAVALAAAARAPRRVGAVVSVGVALELPAAGRAGVLELARAARDDGMAAVAPILCDAGTSAAFRAEQPGRYARFHATLAERDARGFSALAHAVAGVELGSWVDDVAAPVLLVAAPADELSPIAANEALAGRLTDARLHVLEHGGHEVPIEQPDALVAVVRDGAR